MDAESKFKFIKNFKLSDRSSQMLKKILYSFESITQCKFTKLMQKFMYI